MSEAQPEPEASAAVPSPTALAIPQLVAVQGSYPPPGGGGGAPYFTLGMLQSFAGPFTAFGAPTASGQLVAVSANPPLFSIYGPSFGGDGQTSFALPNLDGVTAIGSVPGQRGTGTLGMTWLIAADSGRQVPAAGMIAMFGGQFAPSGWMVANGSMLPIAEFVPLFETISNTYGGDGTTYFALPDLRGAAPVGIGGARGRPPVELGEKLPGAIPGLGLNYLICISGLYPNNSGAGDLPSNEPFLGQVVAFAGPYVPSGWAQCNGALLPIRSNPALYNVIGNTYGGDGTTSFALPNLAGLMTQGQPL